MVKSTTMLTANSRPQPEHKAFFVFFSRSRPGERRSIIRNFPPTKKLGFTAICGSSAGD